MEMIPGQCLSLKLPYADGGLANKQRPFIIINCSDETIEMLNVSSVKGKEKKLFYPSNELIDLYNPPLHIPSFVKLDAFYRIEYISDLRYCLYSNGESLDSTEFKRIKKVFTDYKNTNNILISNITVNEVLYYNSSYITQGQTAANRD